MFGEKQYGEHSGYPTPEDIPSGVRCLTLRIPDDASWWSIYVGLLQSLAEEEAWQQFSGGMAPEDAAEIAQNILDDAMTEAEAREECPTFMDCNDIYDCIAPYSPLAGSPQKRVSGGKPQISYDGGTTWTDLQDPETNGVPRVPARTVTEGADLCLAATRAMLGLAELYKQTAGAVGADLINTANAIINFMDGLNNALFQLIYSPYDGILEAAIFDPLDMPTDFSDGELSAETKELLTCLLLANASEVGGVVSFDYQAVLDNTISTLGANPGTAVWLLLTYIGADGLNRAGDIHVTDAGECDTCGTWCYVFDLTADDGDWTVQSGRNATYSAGNGWYAGLWSQSGGSCGAGNTTYFGTVNIIHAMAARTVTKVRVTYSGDNGYIQNAAWINNQINLLADGTDVVNYVVNEDFGTDKVMEWTGTAEGIDEVRLQASEGVRCNSSTGVVSANYRIHRVQIEGLGTNPFGEDNCP